MSGGVSSGRTRRVRGQGGFTLTEVLLTVAISTVIMVPLTAWMILAYRTQVDVTHNSARTAAGNLLGSYLPRDVGSAVVVDDIAGDCSPSPSPGDEPVLSMTAAGDGRRTTYLVRAGTGNDGGVLIRRTCAGSGGAVDDIEIIERVASPASSSIVAACQGPCSARHGRVDMTVQLVDGGSISATAFRRVGSDQ